MNIFFDVDFTILGLDDTLRPGTQDLFRQLVEDGHKVHIWSGLGERWEVVRKHDLALWISGVYEKPLDHFHERLSQLGVPIVPDFVLDDYPEVVAAFGGVWMPPYFFNRTSDSEMERVYSIVTEYVGKGYSEDKHFYAKGTKMPLL